jgi:prophage antirepressor-like protein
MDLRVVEIDGEPWFVAPDVRKQLGLTGSPSQHTARLGTSEKKVIEKSHAQNMGLLTLFNARLPRVSIISESGLYKLTMRSDKQEAKQFQDWVTREVLPSIRKTGTYTMPGAKKASEAPSRPRQKTSPHHYKGNHNGHASGHARTKDHIIFKLTLSGRSPQHG